MTRAAAKTLWLGVKAKGCLVPVVNVGCLRRGCAAGLSTGLVGADVLDRNSQLERNPTPMSKSIHFLGLDVHKESVAVSIAPSDSARSGITAASAAHSKTWTA